MKKMVIAHPIDIELVIFSKNAGIAEINIFEPKRFIMNLCTHME